MVVLAVELHITIPFSVILNRVFCIAERITLGMHEFVVFDVENNVFADADAEAVDVDVDVA